MRDVGRSEIAPCPSAAAVKLLSLLLPGLGLQIKGGRALAGAIADRDRLRTPTGRFFAADPHPRTRPETHHAGGLDWRRTSRPRDELPEGSSDPVEAHATDPHRSYTLTHDFLVPVVREWVDLTEGETARGRARLRLRRRADAWDAEQKDRQLPSLLEYVNIRALTKCRDWTPPQIKMMRRARRVHGLRAALAASLALVLLWVGFETYGRVQAQHLLTADPATVPRAIQRLSRWHLWANRYLDRVIQSPQTDDEQRGQLHARLGRMALSGEYDPQVVDADLYTCPLPDIGPLAEVLSPHAELFVDSLWGRLHDASQTADRRFRSGLRVGGLRPVLVPLAGGGLPIPGGAPARYELRVPGSGPAVPAPLRDKVVPQLATYLGNEAARESWQVSAATALADLDFSGADGTTLAEWLAKASDNQYAKLHAVFEAKADPQSASRLRQLVELTPTDETQAQRVQLGRRRAGAAITLLRQSKRGAVPEEMFAALRVTDDPESLSQFVHDCRAREITAEQLWRCVVRADQLRQSKTGPERVMEDRLLFGLLLALGDTPSSELPLEAKDSWVTQLTQWYATDPSSAIHGATGCGCCGNGALWKP